MISQKCPRCGSYRTRKGYRPTPFLLKLILQHNLLCDNCNWEFRGFAIPLLKRRSKRVRKKIAEKSNEIS
ncbi:MAG: hypothetical protein N2Z23_09675 [Pyrinomonadaceae bacterium]|nr:hypothetical protein [Pyrinomonadaceae bacterium]MCX7640691.1 hypothetical protein [Pyrinomonadaceae bacterium]MDW8305395.1 hypothetical protein [Acidobacteriota bacterium]